MAYTFLVLFVCFTSSSTVDIHGTGLIVEYKNQLFLISCKHVFSVAKNKNAIFAIANPKQSWPSNNSPTNIKLGKPYFHLGDIKNDTYDIVVFKLSKHYKQTLHKYGITPLPITSNKKNDLDKKNKFFSIGYPADSIRNYFKKNNEDPLPPTIVEGHIEEIELGKLSQDRFSGKVKEAYFIKTSYGDEMGQGVSGGLVFIKKESDSIIPIGLIIGEKTDVESNFYTKRIVHYIAFAKMERVIEVLNNIH